MRIYVKTAPRCGIFCLKPLAKTQAVKKPILWAFVAKPQAETLVVLYPANFFLPPWAVFWVQIEYENYGIFCEDLDVIS